VVEFNKLNSEFRKIVFYAEDIQSQNYLLDLVKELLTTFNEDVCYLTSCREDTIFLEKKKYPKLRAFYIGSGIVRTWTFINLKADLMIMTMPDIENFHIKKSKVSQVHYLYIFHALVSTHSNYRKAAFDSYDTIFCTGKQQIKEIRETEKYYDLARKNLYRDGYRPLEYLIRENQSFPKNIADKLKILIAPTWGQNNILEHCIFELLDTLVNAKVEIYLRPHPMTLRNNYNKIHELKLKYEENTNICIQENSAERSILFESDILITDWSGIGIEYGLGLEKPVIYIDIPKKNNNPEHDKINITPMEVTIRSEIGKVVKQNEIQDINDIIWEALNTYDVKKISKVREKYVFMKENSLNKSAKRVISIANASRSINTK
jgi:YidC/Oxa1 family membrane protein insertase